MQRNSQECHTACKRLSQDPNADSQATEATRLTMEPLTRPAVLVTDRKCGRGDLSGADRNPGDRACTKRMAVGQCPFYLGKPYLLFFSSLTQCLSRATEGRVGLRGLTISGGFPSATMGKAQQNMWLVGDGHGEFLTLWFRQEAEDTVWNQEWVDPLETSSY